jgi:hypothetical protein
MFGDRDPFEDMDQSPCIHLDSMRSSVLLRLPFSVAPGACYAHSVSCFIRLPLRLCGRYGISAYIGVSALAFDASGPSRLHQSTKWPVCRRGL